jgi:L-histidine N-alpha-methyltransferase
MHLRAVRSQTVHLADRTFELRAGECLHTENSCKYTPEGFRALAQEAGFEEEAFRTDPEGWFGLFLLRCA